MGLAITKLNYQTAGAGTPEIADVTNPNRLEAGSLLTNSDEEGQLL